MWAIGEVLGKVDSMKNLLKMVAVNDKEMEYLEYGERAIDGVVFKDMVTVKQFFDVIDSYVALVQSETKGKHFFRADTAQAKFRALENVQCSLIIVHSQYNHGKVN